MSAFQLRQPTAKPYFVAGAAILSLIAVTLLFRHHLNEAIPRDWLRLWRYGSGVALAGLFAFQWALFFARRSKDGARVRRHYKLHKRLGIISLALFLLHAGTLGYGVMGVVTTGFLIVALTGLFNAEVLLLMPNQLRWARVFVHYAVSAAIVPFIVLHLWVALSFK
jgi:hypothetical protein